MGAEGHGRDRSLSRGGRRAPEPGRVRNREINQGGADPKACNRAAATRARPSAPATGGSLAWLGNAPCRHPAGLRRLAPCICVRGAPVAAPGSCTRAADAVALVKQARKAPLDNGAPRRAALRLGEALRLCVHAHGDHDPADARAGSRPRNPAPTPLPPQLAPRAPSCCGLPRTGANQRPRRAPACLSITAVMAQVPQGPLVQIGNHRHCLALLPHGGRQRVPELPGLSYAVRKWAWDSSSVPSML